ncbi:putative peptidoglycan glycosyltransferase FtsW [Azospirillaceae bacterium]
MNMTFDRTDHSIVGRWWWTIDRWLLGALGLLIIFGTELIAAASPAVAERIGLSTYYFLQHHILTLVPTLAIVFGVSLMAPRNVRRLALIVFLASLLMVAMTPFVGMEIKGARRWIHFPGLSLQPSEFVKPAFAVVAAWLFSLQKTCRGFPGTPVSIGLYAVVVALLMRQPDLGMTVVVSAVWFTQFFLAGLNVLLVVFLAMAGVVGLVGAYFMFPHVTSRIDRFLYPNAGNPGTLGDNYQVARAMEAFSNGGVFGVGPGQGAVKLTIPDSHADFVFAVAGEELGLLWCVALVCLFAFIVLRGFSQALKDDNYFILLATGGLLTQFGLQAIINMASTLHLMPTKGMTLPFVSYGGSSLFALGFSMGMVLAFTRHRYGGEAV